MATLTSAAEREAIEQFRKDVIEPSTPTLARLCSTPELRPLTKRKPRQVASGRVAGA